MFVLLVLASHVVIADHPGSRLPLPDQCALQSLDRGVLRVLPVSWHRIVDLCVDVFRLVGGWPVQRRGHCAGPYSSGVRSVLPLKPDRSAPEGTEFLPDRDAHLLVLSCTRQSELCVMIPQKVRLLH